jgi:hypothetical protein
MTHAPFPVRVLEEHAIVTPLGVRFVDDFSGLPIGRDPDLEVWTWPEGTPERRIRMHPAGSNTFAAHGLPGWREFEAGPGDERFWQSWLAKEKRTFVVEARDHRARFLPLQVRVEVPVAGVAGPVCAAQLPSNRRHAVPLFSAPTRVVPATAAIIRADLFDRAAGHGAAWAVVEAMLDGQTVARGMADDKGRLVLLLRYPEPQSAWTSPASPASSPRSPLSEQSWTLDLVVRYERALPARAVPDLCDALAQSPAQLLADAGSPSIDLLQCTLHYGSTTVLRTAGTFGNEHGCVLVITSGSPQ